MLSFFAAICMTGSIDQTSYALDFRCNLHAAKIERMAGLMEGSRQN